MKAENLVYLIPIWFASLMLVGMADSAAIFLGAPFTLRLPYVHSVAFIVGASAVSFVTGNRKIVTVAWFALQAVIFVLTTGLYVINCGNGVCRVSLVAELLSIGSTAGTLFAAALGQLYLAILGAVSFTLMGRYSLFSDNQIEAKNE